MSMSVVVLTLQSALQHALSLVDMHFNAFPFISIEKLIRQNYTIVDGPSTLIPKNNHASIE